MSIPNQLLLVSIGQEIALPLCFRVDFFFLSQTRSSFIVVIPITRHITAPRCISLIIIGRGMVSRRTFSLWHTTCGCEITHFRAFLLRGVKKSVHCRRCGGGRTTLGFEPHSIIEPISPFFPIERPGPPHHRIRTKTPTTYGDPVST